MIGKQGYDLQAAVEDYTREFGCYPGAVLADKIYQIRANKLIAMNVGFVCPTSLWAIQRRIRLTQKSNGSPKILANTMPSRAATGMPLRP